MAIDDEHVYSFGWGVPMYRNHLPCSGGQPRRPSGVSPEQPLAEAPRDGGRPSVGPPPLPVVVEHDALIVHETRFAEEGGHFRGAVGAARPSTWTRRAVIPPSTQHHSIGAMILLFLETWNISPISTHIVMGSNVT